MKKITGIIVLVLTAALLFAACGQTGAETSGSPSQSVSAGETASTKPSTEASKPAEPVNIKAAGSTSVGPALEALAEKYMAAHTNVTIDVEQTGSGAGVTSCGDGTADLGMSSRDLKDEEQTLYPDMQTTLLCVDGLAVVVSKDNPVTSLTAEQIKQIFLGEITDWSDVGGDAGPITLYSRDSVSGTREAFQTLLLGKNDAGEQIEIDDDLCLIVGSNGEMATDIENDVTGIGYMSLGLVASYKLSAVTIDGVEATTDNLVAGTYIYSRNFNLLTMGKPTGELAAFIEYCLTDAEALGYLEEKGYLLP
jgi:ABC-type phosphate transport system, periplasmic component